MKAQPCSSHHFVTTQLGEPLGRQCVYCGAGPVRRLVQTLTAMLPGNRPKWCTDAKARAAWDVLNSPIAEEPALPAKTDLDAA